jgi:hypothetical protein
VHLQGNTRSRHALDFEAFAGLLFSLFRSGDR